MGKREEENSPSKASCTGRLSSSTVKALSIAQMHLPGTPPHALVYARMCGTRCAVEKSECGLFATYLATSIRETPIGEHLCKNVAPRWPKLMQLQKANSLVSYLISAHERAAPSLPIPFAPGSGPYKNCASKRHKKVPDLVLTLLYTGWPTTTTTTGQPDHPWQAHSTRECYPGAAQCPFGADMHGAALTMAHSTTKQMQHFYKALQFPCASRPYEIAVKNKTQTILPLVKLSLKCDKFNPYQCSSSVSALR